jgi:hypothetical protein
MDGRSLWSLTYSPPSLTLVDPEAAAAILGRIYQPPLRRPYDWLGRPPPAPQICMLLNTTVCQQNSSKERRDTTFSRAMFPNSPNVQDLHMSKLFLSLCIVCF